MLKPTPPILITCCLVFLGAAPVAEAVSYARQCLAAIQQASRNSGVPEDILLAVAMTESGRQGENGPEPWPWALNQGGESKWFDSESKALDWLHSALAQGVTNIDIGCFQLNWRWHGEAFASTVDMMDPQQNAEYAAEFLLRLKQQTGTWDKAVAGYHSFTPELATRYMERFRPIYAALQNRAADEALPAEETIRINTYPLLQAGSIQTAGSLVALQGGARPLFGAP